MQLPNQEAWSAQVAERITVLLRRRSPRWSLVDLSRAAGVPYQSLHGWINLHRKMPAVALVRLAVALGVSVDVLAGVE